MPGEDADATASEGDGRAALERPPFRGCVFCYAAEMTLYAARKARR
ncbi:MAG: hypothetical protein ABEJ82_08935 [Haloplanus sp.]